MSKPIYILNGPNLNLLGTREPDIYGYTTLTDLKDMCTAHADARGLEVFFAQSNREYEIIEWIHEAIEGADGIIINPAALTHTSLSILDALKNVNSPIIEVHISESPHSRRFSAFLLCHICGDRYHCRTWCKWVPHGYRRNGRYAD